MNYDGKAAASRPIADDISVGHVILRQPAPAASNSNVQSFVAHCEDFLATGANSMTLSIAAWDESSDQLGAIISSS
ncbi:MAG: hypothetical protein ACERLB_12505, partial [Gammaproteobacteria bacterium]